MRRGRLWLIVATFLVMKTGVMHLMATKAANLRLAVFKAGVFNTETV